MDSVSNQAMERKGGDSEVPRPCADVEAFRAKGKMAGISAAAAMTTALRRLGQVCFAIRAERRLTLRQRCPAQRAERRCA